MTSRWNCSLRSRSMRRTSELTHYSYSDVLSTDTLIGNSPIRLFLHYFKRHSGTSVHCISWRATAKFWSTRLCTLPIKLLIQHRTLYEKGQ